MQVLIEKNPAAEVDAAGALTYRVIIACNRLKDA